jgi:carboxylesterase
MVKNKIHFVLIAGFSADHMEAVEMKYILEEKGYSAEAISFYGRNYIDDFTHLTLVECLRNISEAINEKAKKYDAVYGIGISLGGALLLEYAKKFSNLKGIVSIGTPVKLSNRKLLAAGQKIIPLIYPVWRRLQKIKQLRLNPIGATKIVINYLEDDLPKNLEKINIPVLLIHSKKDLVSDYRALPDFLEKIKSEKKKIIFSDSGNHVINNDSELIIKYALDFFEIKE